MKRTTVYVAEDHPVFRDGLVRAIRDRPDLEVVGDAGDGRAALEEIRERRPAVALLDIRMPELDGIAVLQAVRRDRLDTAVVLLSAFVDDDLIFQSIAAGAVAYVSKEADRDEICDVLAAAGRGETRLSIEVQTQLAAHIRARSQSTRPLLTPREREVLQFIAEGLSAPEIGSRLHLSPTTVKTHLQTLYEKLGVSDRAAAVATAMRRRLLE